MRTLLKNGRILDPSQEMDRVGSVLIEDDQVVGVGDVPADTPAEEVVDCTGLWITPGLVDLHVHLREPGHAHKETIATGTQAAAAGGYTTILCMPNTQPPLDSPALVDYLLDRAAAPDAGGVFVAPVGALTRGLGGKELAELAAMKDAGIVAASDEEFPIQNSLVMTRAMEMCVQLDLPILAHCEDTALSAGGSMNEGAVSAMLGLRGIPRSAEEIAIARNGILSLHTGARLHVMRVSSWGGVELVRNLKFLGAPVTCEICPMHFALTEDAVGEFDTRYKALPPLRTQHDVDLLIQGIADGTIDCIASDHSPHASHEVDVPFEEAPFGTAQLESTVGVTLTHLYHRGHLSALDVVRKLSTEPARIVPLDAGTLRPGGTPVAQVTVIAPDHEWTFDRKRTYSKSKNTPFHGARFRGKTMLTIVGGEIYRDAALGDPA